MTSLLLSPEPPWAIDLAAARDYALADADEALALALAAKTPASAGARRPAVPRLPGPPPPVLVNTAETASVPSDTQQRARPGRDCSLRSVPSRAGDVLARRWTPSLTE